MWCLPGSSRRFSWGHESGLASLQPWSLREKGRSRGILKNSGQILGQSQSGPWDNLNERTLGVFGSTLHYIEAKIGSESRGFAKGQRWVSSTTHPGLGEFCQATAQKTMTLPVPFPALIYQCGGWEAELTFVGSDSTLPRYMLVQ